MKITKACVVLMSAAFALASFSSAEGAAPRARPAFNKAAAPKSQPAKVTPKFRAAAGHRTGRPTVNIPRGTIRLGQKNTLSGRFNAHGASYRQPLPKALSNKMFGSTFKRPTVNQWRTVRQSLQGAIRRGESVRLSSNGHQAKPGTEMAWKIAHLKSHGYRLSTSGDRMIPGASKSLNKAAGSGLPPKEIGRLRDHFRKVK